MQTKKEKYQIEGMSCSGCERTVSKVVGNLEGVKSSTADLATSSLSVEYDPSIVTVEAIKSAVERTGYKLVGELGK